MRILITGATSMIGLALVKKLIHDGHQIIAVCRAASRFPKGILNNELVELVCCDMKDYGSIAEKIDGNIDAAVLLAWNGTRGVDRMVERLQRTNEEYNLAILPQLKKLGCKKVMTAGSQAEYGSLTSSVGIKESDPACPNTEYGKSKLRFYQKADEFCKENGMQLYEPRFFSLYGPEDYQGTLVISLIQKMMKNEQCELTQCIQTWDYLYIDDAIEGINKLLIENHSPGIYNFGSGECCPLRHFVEIMYRATNSKSILKYGAIPYPSTGMINVHPDVSKLKSIGWAPCVGFIEGISQVIKKQKEFQI